MMRQPKESTTNIRSQTIGGLPLTPSILLLLGFLTMLLVLAGCTRRFYRAEADQEVAEVVEEKSVCPEWNLSNYHVYPHPLARFADPTNPDRPPMPPDDPGAWYLSPKPQRPRQVAYVEGTGYLGLLAEWSAENRARLAAQPGAPVETTTPTYATPTAPGTAGGGLGTPDPNAPEPFLINLTQALELGFLNSREFQNRREDLYLTALPVTLERYAFAPQFFARDATAREWGARNSSIGKQNRWTHRPVVGLTKLFSTGASLLFQVANTTTVNLTGNRKHTLSQSTMLLDFIQPLLRGGGRAVTLEPLTQVERNLLYELRDFARFHKEFFVAVAAGGGGLGGPSPGYYPTLRSFIALQNELKNVRSLESFLDRYRNLATGGGVSDLQVGQVEQDRLTADSRVLVLRAQYSDNLDQFKLQVGVPTNLPLELDLSPLQGIQEQVRRFESIEAQWAEALDGNPAKGVVGMRQRPVLATPPDAWRPLIYRELTQSDLVRGVYPGEPPQNTRFRERVEEYWGLWESLRTRPENLIQHFNMTSLPLAQPLVSPFGLTLDLSILSRSAATQTMLALIGRASLEDDPTPVTLAIAERLRRLRTSHLRRVIRLIELYEDAVPADITELLRRPYLTPRERRRLDERLAAAATGFAEERGRLRAAIDQTRQSLLLQRIELQRRLAESLLRFDLTGPRPRRDYAWWERLAGLDVVDWRGPLDSTSAYSWWERMLGLDFTGAVWSDFHEIDQGLAVLDLFEKEPAAFLPALEDAVRNVAMQIELGRLALDLAIYEAMPWLAFPGADETAAGRRDVRGRPVRGELQLNLFRRVLNKFTLIMEIPRLERFDRLAQRWPEVPLLRVCGIDLLELNADSEFEAQNLVAQTALNLRLDLMNQRAILVDAWREIAVSANGLLGTFDVRYNMEILTPPPLLASQPLNFQGQRSRHQLTFNTELPLVRKFERNNYRAALIAYQRQRRALMAAEDTVVFQVRQGLRQLQRFALDFRIQQRAVPLAFLRVDNSLETFLAPPAPGGGQDAATQAAALTQQLLQAQSQLPSSQNALYQAWISYITTRMALYRDLELLRVDGRGVWIDEYAPLDCFPRAEPRAGGAGE